MNIAFFTKRTTFHKGYGGMETQNEVLCEGLVKRGHKITVFSPDWDQPLKNIERNNVKYRFVKCVYRMGPIFGFFGSLQQSNWINRSYEEFTHQHDQRKFDLIVAQSSTGLGVIRKKHFHQVPIVSISHGTILGEYRTFVMAMSLPKDLPLLIKNTGFTFKNFFRRQRDFVHGSTMVVAVSNPVKKALLEETFTNTDRITVIPNGIDPTPFFPPNTKLKRKSRLLYVGQILKSKGLEDIVKLFDDPRFDDFSIDIVGSGDMLEPLKEQTKNNSRISFLGKVPYSKVVNNYFKNQDYGAFVFPTKRYEGFPMVIVEAMFAGLPVVVYDKGGVADAVTDGVTGYLVAENDFETLKLRLLEILKDSKLRVSLSSNSLKKAYETFTLDQMLDSYEKVFKKVIK